MTKLATPVTTHPRAYRVSRAEPGIDWSTWRNTYHPTIEKARAAAESFLRGGTERYRYRYGRSSASRTAVIGERREYRGRAEYSRVERWSLGTGGEAKTEVIS